MRVLRVALSAWLLGHACHADLPAQTTGPQGTGPQSTGPQGTGPQGTGPQGTGPQGTGPQGTGPQATRQKATRLQGLIDSSIARLRQPEQRLDALRRLEHLGRHTVPALKRLIHWQHRTKLSRQNQLDVLYLLGQAGKPAAAALPELREWLRQNDRAVMAQLMSTLAHLVPHCSAEVCNALRIEIRNRSLRTTQYRELHYLLRLGGLHGEGGANSDAVRMFLANSDADHCAAAGRWICATHVEGSARYRKLLPVLERRIAEFTRRKLVAFARTPLRAEAVLAEAWLKLRTDEPNEAIARALLGCRLPDDRLRGVLWLQDHGRSLSLQNRVDLAGRLWDGDATVAKAAARCLASWGMRGFVGLPALLQHAHQHDEPSVRKAYAAAAATLIGAIDSLPSTDAAWLRAAIACLQATPKLKLETLPAKAAGPAAKQALVELLMLACWCDAKQIALLLQLAEHAGADESMTAVVYSWLRHQDHAICDLALSWLARHRQHVGDAINAREGFPQEDECHTLPNWVPLGSRGAALEATAWFLSADASTLDLHDLLGGRNTRLQARALADLLFRNPAQLQRIQHRLHELCNLADTEVLATRQSPEDRWRGYPYQLAKPVRVLAALTLAHSGVTAPDRNGLNQLVIDRCDTTLDELVARVKKRRADGTLREWVEALEAECRRGLFVPVELRWPSAR